MADADLKYTFYYTFANVSYTYDSECDLKVSLKVGRTKIRNYVWLSIIRRLAIQWMFRNKILYMNNYALISPLNLLYEEFGLFEDNKNK